jgi:hypothetical protein
MSAVYELVNPSDMITFEAASVEAAKLAGLFVGNGGYGVKGPDGEQVLSIWLFGGEEADILKVEGFPQTTFAEAVEAHRTDMIAALRTFAVADASDRRAAPEVFTDPVRLAAWNEAKRTSMNNIVRRALALAYVMSVAIPDADGGL